MLGGGHVAERVRDQGLAPVECDIPDRWSIAEYQKALAIAAATAPDRPSPLRRLPGLRRSHAAAGARSSGP
jgi:hypothetical protein